MARSSDPIHRHHDDGRPRRAHRLAARPSFPIPLRNVCRQSCLLILLAWPLAGGACEEPPPPPQRNVTAGVSLDPILSLRANCRTLLAAGVGGVTYVAQVTDDAQERIRAIDNAGRVRETTLNGSRLAEAMGLPQAPASLRAMTALPNGNLLLYVNGFSRRRALTSLWLWNPATDALRQIATEEDLANASGMGPSVELADATLTRADGSVWLVLRHVDATRCLQLDVHDLTTRGSTRLARPFEQLRDSESGDPVRLAADDVVFGRGDGTLWLLRREEGLLRRIGSDGRLHPADPPPADRPPLLAPPLDLDDPRLVTQPAAQRQVLFLPNVGVPADAFATASLSTEPMRRYPAFVFTGPRQTFIERDEITARPTFPVHALRITSWCIDPNSGLIHAYDAMSGELLRVHRRGI